MGNEKGALDIIKSEEHRNVEDVLWNDMKRGSSLKRIRQNHRVVLVISDTQTLLWMECQLYGKCDQ